MVDDKEKDEKNDAEEVKEILSVVSTQVPGLIKSILASVFSEEAGRSMGKAAAAYYKELKDGGMPEQAAVRMTEDYMKTFTDLGQMMKGIGRVNIREGHEAHIGEEISQAFDKTKHEKERRKEE
jgi:hypothetical protein